MRALLLVLLSATVAAAPASAAVTLRPTFTTDPSGACGLANGISVTVSTDLAEGTTKKKARAIKRKYHPQGKAQLAVAGTSLTVTPDFRSDFLSNVQVAWGFRSVEVSKAFAAAAIGKRAKLTYDTKAGSVTLRKKVARAGCG